MCLKQILSWFYPSLKLPHPEEPRDPTATVDSVSVVLLRHKWETDWQVPILSWPFWDRVQIVVTMDTGEYPELTYADLKKIWLRPDFANPGVLAHAAAHVSWGLMPEADRADFETEYNALKDRGIIKALREQHPYADANINEAHSEVYRFLGTEMPEPLRAFYPKLIEV